LYIWASFEASISFFFLFQAEDKRTLFWIEMIVKLSQKFQGWRKGPARALSAAYVRKSYSSPS
jgi:hypothetical protein